MLLARVVSALSKFGGTNFFVGLGIALLSLPWNAREAPPAIHLADLGIAGVFAVVGPHLLSRSWILRQRPTAAQGSGSTEPSVAPLTR